ncbi:hypothetical protein IWW39_001793 [Coemansia spiralis]|uniref:Uncharacterized protein n=1 Tax=Coemansia spiralis TaxID=417178 RepID=A0A9W8GPJ8_9FUNG|nr:hypothetical protein IWW39_001793 [Coemansia spiralis]
MDREEADQIIDSVEKLLISNRALCSLFARVDAQDAAIQDLRSHLTSAREPTECVVRGSEELAQTNEASRDIKKSITAKRLNDLRLEVGAKKSTWADLRKQFSPKGTVFAPKKLITSSRPTSTCAPASEMDAKLAVDEVYSQAATMTAYGVEVLRVALSGPQVDRKLAEQAGDMFATLLATLLGTLEQNRAEIKDLAAERVAARRHELGLGEEPESISNSINANNRSRRDSNKAARRSKGLSKRPVGSKRGHPYRRNTSHVETLGPRQHTVCDSDITRSKSGSAPPGDSTAGTRTSAHLARASANEQSRIEWGESPAAARSATLSDTENTAVESTSDTSEANGPVNILSRQAVIRAALLRQGKSASEIDSYFNKPSVERPQLSGNCTMRQKRWQLYHCYILPEHRKSFGREMSKVMTSEQLEPHAKATHHLLVKG